MILHWDFKREFEPPRFESQYWQTLFLYDVKMSSTIFFYDELRIILIYYFCYNNNNQIRKIKLISGQDKAKNGPYESRFTTLLWQF